MLNAVSSQSCTSSKFPWPNPSFNLMFYHSLSNEEPNSNQTSFLNKIEASNVDQALTYLLKQGIKPYQIGIITQY